ncbi:hypothetical protein KIN20_003732 [Parelaphostrongylus tenuis]|uniref:Uncharacterized protein n=1 Tax=Parelaphostrongylus tenuis TaxID=148309 RepID=A0AAD5QDX7_PARTN|nr:hypothetical protein KIN20_003732 [Parelaphostrongylus tenuis]
MPSQALEIYGKSQKKILVIPSRSVCVNGMIWLCQSLKATGTQRFVAYKLQYLLLDNNRTALQDQQ